MMMIPIWAVPQILRRLQYIFVDSYIFTNLPTVSWTEEAVYICNVYMNIMIEYWNTVYLYTHIMLKKYIYRYVIYTSPFLTCHTKRSLEIYTNIWHNILWNQQLTHDRNPGFLPSKWWSICQPAMLVPCRFHAFFFGFEKKSRMMKLKLLRLWPIPPCWKAFVKRVRSTSRGRLDGGGKLPPATSGTEAELSMSSLFRLFFFGWMCEKTCGKTRRPLENVNKFESPKTCFGGWFFDGFCGLTNCLGDV